jgi:hypothetical protein
MDKVKFKNKKAKPYTEKKVLDILNKAFPAPDSDDAEDQDDAEDWDNEENESEDEARQEYEGLTAKELYLECVERGLKAPKKKKADFYIDMLVKDDLEEDETEEHGDVAVAVEVGKPAAESFAAGGAAIGRQLYWLGEGWR